MRSSMPMTHTKGPIGRLRAYRRETQEARRTRLIARQSPYFIAAAKATINAVATANSANQKHASRSRIVQFIMSDLPTGCSVERPRSAIEREIVAIF